MKLAMIPIVAIPLVLLATAPVKWRGGSRMSGSVSDVKLDSKRRCDVFQGNWVPYYGGTYYNDSSCALIMDQVNCLKFGRLDSAFQRWRWKPDGCELPLFDARRFLEVVRGKSMAFIGDSLGRNQMNSLQCLLSAVESPKDVTKEYRNDPYFPQWYFPSYNFTLATLWSPFLVTILDSGANDNSLHGFMSLQLDEPDVSWASEINRYDFVILSAGIWMFRPLIFHENGHLTGCNWKSCEKHKTTHLGRKYGFRKVFQTTFRMLLQQDYRGIAFFRTYSPQHYENGRWNTGGKCARTEPFASFDETRLIFDEDERDAYRIPVEEFNAAKKVAKERGLKLKLLDTTKMMLLRPDGHPNFYKNQSLGNTSIADCVHWCLPGPIDTLNEILQYYLISK